MSVKAKGQAGYTDVDTGGIKWNQLAKLMQMGETYNRPNREGAFGAWEYQPAQYDIDKDGNQVMIAPATQKFRATTPGMQAAQDRMDRRLAGEGFDPYEPPSQVSSITDALMADKMQKMGLLPEGDQGLAQDEYGKRFADRSGSGMNTGQPPPPPAAAPPPDPTQPPGGNPPPGTGQPPGGVPPISGGGQRPPAGGGGVRPPTNRPPMRPHAAMTPEEAQAMLARTQGVM